MAAAEARAAWQRANRCFVQEDAKRAPKLACCPSASMMQNDSSTGSTCSQDHVAPSFMSVSWSTMNPNLSPDAKWWLQLQPHFGYHKDYICEQLSSLAEEFDEEVEIMIPKSKVAAETLLDESVDVDPKNESHLDSPWMVSCKNHGSERNSGIKSVTDYSQEPLKPKVDQIYKDEELLDWKPGDRFMSKRQEKASSCLETPWAAANKSEPWWRIVDKDELALLVAQKSLEHSKIVIFLNPHKQCMLIQIHVILLKVWTRLSYFHPHWDQSYIQAVLVIFHRTAILRRSWMIIVHPLMKEVICHILRSCIVICI